MIDHVSIAITDLAKARAFYTAVLATLGLSELVVRPTQIGFGKTYPEIWINFRAMLRNEDDPGSHVALRARSTDAVDAFHRAAIEGGAHDDGAPGLRPYGSGPNGYYAAFVRDPDGNRIEAVPFVPRP